MEQQTGRRSVLIAGCGYVGVELGRRLAADGDVVWGLRRDPSSIPAPIRPLAGDVASADLPALPTVDAVVYAVSAGGRTADRYRRAYVDGPRNVLAALEAAGRRPERFVLVSSTGVYGQTEGEWVDESSPTEPADETGRLLLEGERAVLGSAANGVVVRAGGIYGPDRTGLLDRIRSGVVRRPPPGTRWLNLVHRDDLARALGHVLRLADPGPTLAVVDEEPADYDEVVAWLARRAGVPVPPAVTESDGGRRGTNKRVSSERLRRTGFRFLYPTFREGYGALLGG